MNADWKFSGTCIADEELKLNGVNVWACRWERVPNAVASIRDPLYNQPYEFNVYDLVHAGGRVRVAAGEFSNCIYGFYMPVQEA